MLIKALKLKPVTKEYIWGGRKLKAEWGKEADTATVSESWELSDFPGSESVIDDEMYPGYTLGKLYEKHPEFFGDKIRDFKRFPLLIKLVDAGKDLSVQVHPNDEYAAANEGGSYGKTECWYVLDADPDSYILLGFKREVTREELKTALESGTVTELMNKIYVKPGDFYFVPAGTVHALCKGVTVLEVQENSNITYRLYDYNRTDKDGNPRKLHIKEALEVANLSAYVPEAQKECRDFMYGKVRKLCSCEYFKIKEVQFNDLYIMYAFDGFAAFTVAEGEGKLLKEDAPNANADGVPFKKGDTFFVPRGAMVRLVAPHGKIIITEI